MCKSSLCVIVTIGFLIFTAPAEAVITFERTYGGISEDGGFSVQETQDGGYIIAGMTRSFGTGGSDVWLIKTDAAGDTVWTNTYGGIHTDWGFSVQETQDGGYIIAGSTWSFGAGLSDVYLIKTDSLGNTVWTNTYGGTDYDWGRSVQETQDGGYIIAGMTGSFGAGYGDVYLIKTDAAGDTVWTKTYGGIYDDAGYSVQETQDGGYIIVGYTWDYDYDTDVYLIKTNAAGDTVWTNTYGGAYRDEGYSVQETQDGGYIIAGRTTSYGPGTPNYESVYLIKTDSAGDTVWTKTYGGIYDDPGYSVQETQDGGYIIAGMTDSFGAGNEDVYLIKTDSEGMTGVVTEEGEGLSVTTILYPLSPNPFSSSLGIKYSLPEPSQVELSVYDLAGRLINTLVNGSVSTGEHTTVWNPDPSLPVGCYLIVLDADGDRTVRRCVKLE